MRLASYNVENLFERVKVMNLDSAPDRKAMLSDYAKFNTLIGREKYSAADKTAMLRILDDYGMLKSGESECFLLRENHGHLLQRAKGSAKAAIVAGGRHEWIGWLELKKEPVNEIAIANTARVIKDLDADVLGVIEADDRPGLERFNEQVLASNEVRGEQYRNVMLIDGNDERGIDVGILTRDGYDIELIQSHVNEKLNGGHLFSRDCAAYQVKTREKDVEGHPQVVWVLVNHLKSKGGGSFKESAEKRAAQAKRVRQIYDSLIKDYPYVAVIGDFNDTPDSQALKPLLGDSAPLKDVSEGPNFDDEGRPGTYGNSARSNKIDYILCSPELMKKMKRGGISHMGVWGGENGTLFPHYDTITGKHEAASDHAAIWADFDI